MNVVEYMPGFNYPSWLDYMYTLTTREAMRVRAILDGVKTPRYSRELRAYYLWRVTALLRMEMEVYYGR